MNARRNDAGLYEQVIDDQRYEFEKWGSEDGVDALLDLFTILGKPAGAGVAAFFGENGPAKAGLDSEVDPNIIGTIIEKLSDRVGANKALCKDLIRKLASSKVSCNGKKVVFDQHYKDNYAHLFKVLRAGLEVQFSSFFGDGSGRSAILGTLAGVMNRGTPT